MRFRRPLLHNRSVATIPEAIERHRNEAELARRGYVGLSQQDRDRLIAFLRSL
ncbi:MAG: di-heme oxidoredictase family protein [Vicinamibacterales bacterium]